MPAPVAPGAGVALIVWFALDVIAIVFVGSKMEHASPSDPVNAPWVRMLTVCVPVPAAVRLRVPGSEAVGAIGTGAAALTTFSGVVAGGAKSVAPTPSHVVTAVLISAPANGPIV